MKAQPKGLLYLPSKEQKKETLIHTGHKLGTIVNSRNIKHVENKKKLLGKLNACKYGTIFDGVRGLKVKTFNNPSPSPLRPKKKLKQIFSMALSFLYLCKILKMHLLETKIY